MQDITHRDIEQVGTVVIGGGQAGLVTAHGLAAQGHSFVVLDAAERTGDSWRNRWDSLRLFTPGRYDGLPGLAFSARRHRAPTKDQMADYLEAYAAHFSLPIRHGVHVTGVSTWDGRFTVTTDRGRLAADNVVVATGASHRPWTPDFASELDPAILQLHSSDYRRPDQLRPGGVLLVGAGNSGAEIALDIAATHDTWLAGRHPGHVPFRIDTVAARLLLIRLVRFVGHRVLTFGTPVGRKVLPKMSSGGDPLVRVKPRDIASAGVHRVGRVVGVAKGRPVLEDGEVLDVGNVVWCTGFRHDYPWIDLPVLDDAGRPRHERGVVAEAPGLYFVGMEFQYAATSGTVTGTCRDAGYVLKQIAKRSRALRTREVSEPQLT